MKLKNKIFRSMLVASNFMNLLMVSTLLNCCRKTLLLVFMVKVAVTKMTKTFTNNGLPGMGEH